MKINWSLHCRHFETLQKVNEEFEEFLYTVKTDLKEKSSDLKRVRDADSSSRRCRSYAVIQLFMLQQYEQRLNRFDFLSRQSLFKLSRKFLNGDDIDEQVSDHITIIMRMKRRMKGFLDVSEKYLVLDVTDSVTQMTELCERLEGRSPKCSGEFDVSTKNLSQRQQLTAVSCKFSVSTSGLNNLFESKVPRSPRSRSLSYSGSENVERKTLRSVTDHLLVMSKSFTNRL